MQLGDAEELYRHPASVFVARFIGHTNLLPAVVRSVANGRVEIEVAGQRHSVESQGANLRPGMAVTAVVRPESIGISATETNEGSIAGVVASCTYLGDTASMQSKQRAEAVSRWRKPQPSDRLAPGAAVCVRLPSVGIQLLQEVQQ